MTIETYVAWPTQLGACIDILYKNRASRLQLQHDVDAMKAQEQDLQNHILDTFTKSELQGAKGDVATASIKRTTSVNTVDWPTFLLGLSTMKRMTA